MVGKCDTMALWRIERKSRRRCEIMPVGYQFDPGASGRGDNSDVTADDCPTVAAGESASELLENYYCNEIALPSGITI